MSSTSTDDNELARYLASYIFDCFCGPGREDICVNREMLEEAIKEFYDSYK